MDIVIMLLLGLGFWVFYRIMVKEPIIPGGKKKVGTNTSPNIKTKKKQKKKKAEDEEEEPAPFQELFPDIKEIANHMIRFHDNRFVMMCEIEPCNYFLLSQDEQEQIDVSFETWLAQINYPVQCYLQNRYIDLSEPIESMHHYMENEDGLNEHALEYGRGLLDDLTKWQFSTPRYETKRFLIFSYHLNVKDIKADDSEEFEEKIINKAFAELFRRYNSAKNALRKANMEVQFLTTERLIETLYYSFNRRKAVKNKFKNIGLQEMLALYCTADQDINRIETVKEMIEREFEEANKQKENIVSEVQEHQATVQ